MKCFNIMLRAMLLGAVFSPAMQAVALSPRDDLPAEEVPVDTPRTLGLDECVQTARENNRLCKVSAYDVRIAKTLLKQARSAYWPSVSAGFIWGMLDEPLVFGYPATTIQTPIPTSTGPLELPVPAQTIELTDDEMTITSLNMKYLLYTGGIRSAINKQAKFGIEAARQGARRTELEVVYDVERAYYGAVMARRLVKITDDTLQRMDVTLELTERLYQEGSGFVKKTDYLQNKTVVEMIRSIMSKMKETQEKADTALVYLMGLPRGSVVIPRDTDLPAGKDIPTVEELTETALEANPELARVRAGLGAYSARVDEKKGNFLPKIVLLAKYAKMDSGLDTGLMHPQNKELWAVGAAVQMPLFEGFVNKNRLLEAKLALEKLKAQEDALREGIVLKIQHAHSELTRACEREVSTGEGLRAAVENRDLNMRAYQDELVETADVIQAQFMAALLDVNYQKTLYEVIEARAQIDMLVGSKTQ